MQFTPLQSPSLQQTCTKLDRSNLCYLLTDASLMEVPPDSHRNPEDSFLAVDCKTPSELIYILYTHFTAEKRMDQEKSFLRWGGLAGILAGIFFILTIVTLVGFGPSTTATPAQLVMNFPNVRTGLAVGNGFYFLVSVSLVGLALGLYRALRGASPGFAVYGTVLYVLGLGVTFIEDTTQVAFDPISNLYHAPGATPADQATLAPFVAGDTGDVQRV
jgi:hypothetical protein